MECGIGVVVRVYWLVLDACKSVLDLLAEHDVEDRDSYLLWVVEHPLLYGLVAEPQDAILHVLLHRHSHRFFCLFKPLLNSAAHLNLPVEQEKLLVARDHAEDVEV